MLVLMMLMMAVMMTVRLNATHTHTHTDRTRTRSSWLQVDGWLPNATSWVQAVKDMAAVVFSMPTVLQCTGYADMSTDPICQLFGCKDHVCQTAPGVKCGDCEAKIEKKTTR